MNEFSASFFELISRYDFFINEILESGSGLCFINGAVENEENIFDQLSAQFKIFWILEYSCLKVLFW